MFELAKVTKSYLQNGVLMCDLLPPRQNVVYEKVPYITQHTSLLPVLQEGDIAVVAKLTGEKRVILGTTRGEPVMEPDNPIPGSVREGELRFRLDEDTQLAFLKQNDGTYDIDIKASGDIELKSEGDIAIMSEGEININSKEKTNIDSDGDVMIQGINFEEHTHDFSGDGDTTEEPNG